MKAAVLQIYIQGKPQEQGKIFFLPAFPVFIFNMKLINVFGQQVPNKLWRSYNSYSIAEQIFEALGKLPSKPSCRIIANLAEKNCYWETTLSKFRKFGFVQPFGNHRQRLLYMKHWENKLGQIDEPKNLPVVTIDKWIKGDSQVAFHQDGTFNII